MTKVIQWNCHHSLRAIDAINTSPETYDIVLIQEPYVDKKGQPKIKISSHDTNFHRGEGKTRACITVNNSLKWTPMARLTNNDFATIKVGDILICSGYLDGNQEAVPDILRDITKFSEENNLRLILGLDCNAHGSLWNCENSNKRGELLEEFILEKGLQVENSGDKPTYSRTGVESIIDITLTRRINIEGWKVNDTYESDHKMISYEIKEQEKLCKESRNLKNADWNRFRNELNKYNQILPSLWTEQTLNEQVTIWEEGILQALDKVAPLRSFKKSKEMAIWWNRELNNKRSEINKLRKKRNKTDEELNIIKEKEKKYFKEIKKAKKKSWNEFCSSTDTIKDMSRLNKIINNTNQSSKIGQIKKDDGSLTMDPKETIETILMKHFDKAEEVKTEDENVIQDAIRINKEELKWINFDSVKASIMEHKPHKAVDKMDFKPIVLQNLPRKHVEILVIIFQASLSLGYTPKQWRKSKVIFIPKAGKVDYTEAKSFRPITLASFVFKTLERVISQELEKHFEKIPMTRLQHAYRKKMGTDTALSEFCDLAEKGLRQTGYCFAGLLDLTGAFDNVGLKYAVKQMEKRGIDPCITKWYKNFVENRIVYSEHMDQKVFKKLTAGVGQGLQLAPTVWNIVFEEILEELNKKGLHVVAYADDICLVCVSIDPNTAVEKVQNGIDKLISWSRESGLKFNPDKTETILFTNKRVKENKIKNIRMYGRIIERSKSVKYLGVIFDEKLKWNLHLDDKIKKCKGQLYTLKKLIDQNWGPNQRMMRWAYTGIVRPTLTYAAHIWAGNINKTMQMKLERLNRLGCLVINSVYKSTPTKALEILYNVSPLHLKLKEIAMENFIRIRKNLTQKLRDFNTRSNTNIKGHVELLNDWTKWVKNENDSVQHKMVNLFQTNLDNNKAEEQDVIYAYSDGSKMNGKVGFGYNIRCNDIEVGYGLGRLKDFNSVYQAELKGIKEVANHLNDLNLVGKTIRIRIDNQAAIISLGKREKRCELAIKTTLELNKLAKRNKVKLEWNKAHDIETPEGNIQADILAKRGTEGSIVMEVKPPINYYKQQIRDFIKEQWSEEWKQVNMCRQTKLFLLKPSKKVTDLLMKSSRFWANRLIGFITGHCNLNYHRNKNDISKQNCRLCNEEKEEPYHLYASCPGLLTIRSQYFGRYISTQQDNWEPIKLMKFIKEGKIQEMMTIVE